MIKRKMASIVVIDDMAPIEGADRLERARVKGWNVVAQKGLYNVGDKAVYFEIDSFLRGDDPRFESFQSRGVRKFLIDGEEVDGHVVKTMKLRGVVSQGLLMPIAELGLNVDDYNVGDDVSDAIGIVKYDVEKPKNAEIIGEFDARFAPKTDAERVQNLSDHWDEIKGLEWEATIKVDGTSQTLFFDGEQDRLRIFGRNWELDVEKAEGVKVAEDTGIADFARENPDVVVQFELAGSGIQSNTLKLSNRQPFVFAVWKDGIKLPRTEWDERLLKVATPKIEVNLAEFDTVDELLVHVEKVARGNITKDKVDEGIVFHLTGEQTKTLPMWMERNANFKAISNKWLIKNNA